jgi:hypothetical protein
MAERYAAAESAVREAIGILSRTHPLGDARRAYCQELLARCLAGQGDTAAAVAVLERALAQRAAVLPVDAPPLLRLKGALGALQKAPVEAQPPAGD